MPQSPETAAARRQLIINGRFLSGPPTAVNNVARDLTKALVAHPRGWQICVAVPPGLADAAASAGLPARVVGHRNGIAWEQAELPRLRKDGVIAGFFNTVPLRGSGYVTMLHDAQVFDAPESYGRATRLWRQLLSRRAAARGNALLTVSDYSKRALLKHKLGSPDRIGVVPNGLGPVGTLPPDRGIRGRLGLHEDRYCVALSTLLPHKNIKLLLRAFEDPRLAETRLVLVGRETRESFTAAGLLPPENVTFAGFVSDAEFGALYAGATAALLPSFEEGFGLPALEAMAHGAVAIVSDRAALPEVVGAAGLVLPADDPAAWVDAVQSLTKDPALRETLASAGRARAQAFTWDAAAETTLAHLERWFPA